MSEIKVNKITPRVACGTTQLGDSGDTFTIPSGATITNSGTASGFGATGETSWDTTVKTTGTFTATAGVGYFLNTTGGIITVNLPAGTAGDSVAMADYAGTWQTSNVTVSPNGSEFIGGVNADITLSTEGQSVTFVYVDGTQGWVNVIDSTSNVRGTPPFVAATGGCVTTCGDYKMHTFLSPNTLVVTCAGNCAGSNTVDYLTVAGGAGGAPQHAGGGGAGGYRTSYSSPLTTPITVTATPYPIGVGGGGAGGTHTPSQKGTNGTPSTFDTITSAGGGGGGNYPAGAGKTGGSGGGGGTNAGSGGAGNTPSIPVGVQGYSGGDAAPSHHPSSGGGGGGGGGAAAVGGDGSAPGGAGAGDGGAGAQNNIDTNNYYWAGGGGGGQYCTGGTGGDGGIGGGGGGGARQTAVGSGGGSAINAGAAGSPGTGTAAGGDAGDNSGGGGGGSGCCSSGGGDGGSGIVIIRYKYQ